MAVYICINVHTAQLSRSEWGAGAIKMSPWIVMFWLSISIIRCVRVFLYV